MKLLLKALSNLRTANVRLVIIFMIFCHQGHSQVMNPGHIGTLFSSPGAPPYLVGARAVWISDDGNYAYVTSAQSTNGGDGGALEIIDITIPNAPVHAGAITRRQDGADIATPSDVVVIGDFAYLVNQGTHSFEIIDVSNPANPRFKGKLSEGGDGAPFLGGAISLSVVGNYAYVVSYFDGSLSIIDISDPTEPTLTGSIQSGVDEAPYLIGAYSIYVEGDYAYVVNYSVNSLQIFDVSDKGNPTYVSSLLDGQDGALLNRPRQVVVDWPYAYVASQSSKALEIIDVSDPEFPAHVGSIIDGQDGASLFGPRSVTVVGDYAFVTSNRPTSGALEIVDISNPAQPMHIGSLASENGLLIAPYDVAVRGDYAYIPCYNGSALEIINIKTLTSPEYFSRLEGNPAIVPPVLNNSKDMKVKGNYAYVVTPSFSSPSSLQIIDVSDRSKPVHEAILIDGDNGAILFAQEIELSGDHAYILNYDQLGINYEHSLEIVDISVPTAPIHKANIAFEVDGIKRPAALEVHRVDVNKDRASIVGRNYLDLIDIDYSTNPISINRVRQSYPFDTYQATAIDAVGDYVFTARADFANSLTIFEILDVSDINNPTIVGSLNVDGYNFQAVMMISGDYAYVTLFEKLIIIDISDKANPSLINTLLNGQDNAIIQPDEIFIKEINSRTYAFLGNYTSIEIIDVTDPLQPVQYKTIWNGENDAVIYGTAGLQVENNYVYFAGDGSFEILYLYSPEITRLSTTKGVDGESITIFGNNFNGSSVVTFNGVEGEVTDFTINTIEVTIPTGANNGKITVNVNGAKAVSEDDFLVRPTTLEATEVSGNSFTANWRDIGGSYYLDVSKDNFNTFLPGYENLKVGKGNSFEIAGLDWITVYQYRVRSSYEGEFTDDSNVSSVQTSLFHSFNNADSPLIPLSKFGGTETTWNLFSIPYNLTNKSIDNIFSALDQERHEYDWKLVRYRNGSNDYVNFNIGTTKVGEAYWFNAKDQITIKVGAGQTVGLPYGVDLQPGWNLVGNPYPVTISWENVLSDPQNADVSGIGSIQVFNGTTQSTGDNMSAFGGGFVWADATATVKIDPRVTGTLRSDNAKGTLTVNMDANAWLMSLFLSDGEQELKAGGFGMHPEASLSKDSFDEMAVPRFFSYTDLFTEHDYFYSRFAQDVVPTSNVHKWEFTLSSNVIKGPILLTWDNDDIRQSSASLYLLDRKSGRVVDMKITDGTHVNLASGDFQFEVVFSATGDEFIPDELILGSAYPNPATNKVTIPVLLPKWVEGKRVELVIYDINGKEVKSLARGIFAPGAYEFTWNIAPGEKLGAGLYISKLRFENEIYPAIENKIILR